jgi:ketopantoate reductase
VPHSAAVRVLVLGAGAIGGYYGGRLLAAGRDVTFLVRPARQVELATIGLQIRGQKGDVDLPNPPVVTAAGIVGPYELILQACKGYDLVGALDVIAPAVGDNTLILYPRSDPCLSHSSGRSRSLLNGMRHVDVLVERFGRRKVLGGHCMISATRPGRTRHSPTRPRSSRPPRIRRARRWDHTAGPRRSTTSSRAPGSSSGPARMSSRRCGRSGWALRSGQA